MKLESLIEQVRAEARPDVGRVLRQLAHDINTPISTLAMDMFSVRLLLEKLAGVNIPQQTKTISDLTEICANLERTSSRLAEYASALSDLVAEPSEAEDGALDDSNREAIP